MAAKTFEDILKFNPFHDAKGRFASSNGYATFTTQTKDPEKQHMADMAIARMKEQEAGSAQRQEPYINGLQLEKAMLDAHKADFNGLSKEEQNAIKRYMSSTGISESYKNKGLVDQAISRSQLPVNATLTRGVTDLPTTMDEAKSMIGQKIGTATEGKPISTSIKPDQNWGTSTIVIRADKGTKGMYVEAARQSKKADQARARYAKEGKVAGEAEFLLPSTTKIKITGVRMGTHNGQDKIIYDAVIDNQVGKSAGGDAFSIFKTDDDKRLVFGWASVSITVDGEQLEDRQKDIIDPEDLEEAAYEYVLHFRDTGEEHIPTMRKKGKLVESCVFTEEKQRAMGIPPGTLPVAWWIGFKIEDDAAWERVKNGTYRMFSIEGKANRIPVEKSQPKGCGVLVLQDGKILCGTRIERGGRGKICGPGGHIEPGETPEEAAKREAMEEFGITCEEMTSIGTIGDGTSAIFLCTKFSGTPKTDEEEMTEPQWRTIEELQDADLFGPFEASLEKLPPAKRPNVAKTFAEILKANPYHDALGRFASGGGGGAGKASSSASMKAYIDGLNPDVEYPERVEHWKKQIQAGNDRPILVSATDENRVIDGNHTLAAYKELGKTPKVYAMDRIEFLLGASEAKDTVEFIRQAIKEGKATEVKKGDQIAKTFEEVLKFNPYHDARGRFATANGYATFTIQTKDPKKQHWADMAIARMKQQAAANPPKPQKNYDSRGFADYDDADYHQLHSRKQYFQQQQLTPAQQKAANDYVNPNTEPGSLYNVAQNLNWAMVNGRTPTGKHKQVYTNMMDAMHNIGYNVTLTRYDHAGMVDSLLSGLGAGSDYTKMSLKQVQKALVGQTLGENKFISTTVNDFSKAPANSQSLFTNRAVKINYKAKANVQGLLMPIGSGGDQGELVLAPTNGTDNKAPKITAVRSTGKTVYRANTGRHYPQIEIDLEWD